MERVAFQLDAGPRDVDALPDAGEADAGVVDDAGAADAGVSDSGMGDAGIADAGAVDAGRADAGAPDAGRRDAGTDSGWAPHSVCGDGTVDVDEGCDDGNTSDRDGCSRDCREWWDEDFRLRARVSLSNPGASLEDVPVLVVLPSSLASEDVFGDTLCFVDDDHATALRFEVDSVDEAQGVARVWVRVPELTSGEQDAIWLYAGYNGAAQAPCGINPVETWRAYTAVWHLGEELDDATAGAVDLTNHGTSPTSGQIGGARQCAPTSAWLSHDGSSSPQLRGDLTLEAWARLDAVHGDFGNQLLTHTVYSTTVEDPAVNVLFSLRYDLPNGMVTYWEHGNGSDVDPASGAFVVNTGAWHHYAITRDASAKKVAFYFDGDLVTEQTYDENPTRGELGRLFVCGNPQVPSRNLDGAIDEVRLSDDVKSAAWLKLSHRSALGSVATVGPLVPE